MDDSTRQDDMETINDEVPALRVRLNRYVVSAATASQSLEKECSQKDFMELCVTNISESQVQISLNADASHARRLDIATIQLQRNRRKTPFLIILNSSETGMYSGQIVVSSRERIVEATTLENHKLRQLSLFDDSIINMLQASVSCASTNCRRAWVDAARSLSPDSVLRDAIRKGLT